MFCDYCGNVLSDTWQYCPYCGKKIKGEPDLLDSLFRDSFSGISIRITSVGGKEPRIRVDKFGVRVPLDGEEPEEPEEPALELESESPHRIPRRVLEPEGEMQQIGHHVLIRVRLPGIDERDVDVRRLEESVEIKAYRDDEAYFKQFHIPAGAQIVSKYMDGDELIVEVG